MKRIRMLMSDVLLFAQIVFFWPFVYLVMLPLRRMDRVLGTQGFARMVRLVKTIANR